jgi:hypothetical protein
MNQLINTVYHSYYFDISKKAEKAAYMALCATLKSKGLKCFETWGRGSHYNRGLDGKVLTLETMCLFENQWNTAPPEGAKRGLRVFDWAQDYHSREIGTNPSIKRGHWLEQTAEMREIRANVYKCGYCGAHEPAQKGYVFCPHCIGSAHLTEEILHLTRMQAVSDTRSRAALTDAERANLLPQYVAAQTKRNTERAKAERAKIYSDFEKVMEKAHIERDGFVWLLDKGVNLENCIYYGHVNKFSFGWRSPLSDDVKGALLDLLVEFPFTYEIKCANGQTIGNEVQS